jgi:hypothetical protein
MSFERKHEVRSSKSETNPKGRKLKMTETLPPRRGKPFGSSDFDHLGLLTFPPRRGRISSFGFRIFLLLVFCGLISGWANAGTRSPSEAAFRRPPQSAGVRCFWWWLNGNVTQEAITRDLEEMKAKGFSGAMIFDAGGAEQRGNRQVPAGPMFTTPAWR